MNKKTLHRSKQPYTILNSLSSQIICFIWNPPIHLVSFNLQLCFVSSQPPLLHLVSYPFDFLQPPTIEMLGDHGWLTNCIFEVYISTSKYRMRSISFSLWLALSHLFPSIYPSTIFIMFPSWTLHLEQLGKRQKMVYW